MAIIQSALLSKGRGSAGSVTFRRLNGKTVVSEKPLVVKNPDSYEQRVARINFMVGANEGWALSPYFATREKLTAVRRATGRSQRGSNLLPLQDFIKRAVKAITDDVGARTQLSSYALNVPSNQMDYTIKSTVLQVSPMTPVIKALAMLDVTGLPRENSELAIGTISVDEGQIQVPVTVPSITNIMQVQATIYAIMVVSSGDAVNRYMVTRTAVASPAAGGQANIQTSIQIPEGQSIHRLIVEVVPLVDVSEGASAPEPQSSLTVGADVLLNA